MDIAFFILIGLLLSAAFVAHTRWGMRLDPDPRPDYRLSAIDAFKDMLIGALLFGAIGPLVAVAAMVVVTSLADGLRLPNLHGLPLFALFAYLIGGIPALATGALCGALHPWLRGWRGVLAAGAAGALMTFLVFAAQTGIDKASLLRPFSQLSQVLWIALMLGLPAGAVCGWIHQRRHGRDD